jgi:abhydrolase domain-containing protein 17
VGVLLPSLLAATPTPTHPHKHVVQTGAILLTLHSVLKSVCARFLFFLYLFYPRTTTMSLQAFVNSIVFSPPENSNTLEAVQLLQRKQYMGFVRKKDGQRITFYHMAPGGGRVSADRLDEVVRSSAVMLFHHGNAEDLGGCYHYAEWLAASFGVAVVMYDYCGYGYSGFPNLQRSAQPPITEKTVYSDADDMYAYLLELGYPEHRIIVVGRSVGGGPACYLAQKHHKKIAGLILISTFTSCLRVVNSCCLPYLCCCVDLFPNYRRMEEVMECPLLIMHGTDDRVVPYHCSGELLEAMEERRQSALERLLRRRTKSANKQANVSSSAQSPWTASPSAVSSIAMSEPRASTEKLGCPPALYEPDSVYDLYQRAFAAIPAEVRDAAARQIGFGSREVQLGTFHKWFPGCGHNDIESQKMEEFAQAIMWFVRFAKAFSAERGLLCDGARNSTGAGALREGREEKSK